MHDLGGEHVLPVQVAHELDVAQHAPPVLRQAPDYVRNFYATCVTLCLMLLWALQAGHRIVSMSRGSILHARCIVYKPPAMRVVLLEREIKQGSTFCSWAATTASARRCCSWSSFEISPSSISFSSCGCAPPLHSHSHSQLRIRPAFAEQGTWFYVATVFHLPTK